MIRDPQTQIVLESMLNGFSITAKDAMDKFQIYRLGARIWDIKRLGYKVESEWIKTPGGARVKRYYMILQPKQTQLKFDRMADRI